MSTAYLTIDDGPTKNTREIMDFLISKHITPIMFFWGISLEEERANGIYAIRKGAIVGNHSHSHPHFSDLTLAECINEIELQENALNCLYRDAGVERKYKIFRFPYGDKGGKNKDGIQNYLKENGFCQIDLQPITYEWYHQDLHSQDCDIYWTFDFEEYRLQYENSFSYEHILAHMHEVSPHTGGSLVNPQDCNIILIHDHPQTDAIVPGYFYDLINRAIELGVQFITPGKL